ncbi:MAG: hypothetical protein HY078_12025 [Elusimicrobia bacterium]|nr:hypothetical protein [Elusimicrobiota bacterium]
MTWIYAALKFAVYSGWCWVGLRALRPQETPSARAALGLGLLRLSMGLGFGVLIWFLASFVAVQIVRSEPLIYLMVYVPVRWVEWGIIEGLLVRDSGPSGFLWGHSGGARGWRVRGIVVSCLADIPVIVSMGGLPLGRFMC